MLEDSEWGSKDDDDDEKWSVLPCKFFLVEEDLFYVNDSDFRSSLLNLLTIWKPSPVRQVSWWKRGRLRMGRTWRDGWTRSCKLGSVLGVSVMCRHRLPKPPSPTHSTHRTRMAHSMYAHFSINSSFNFSKESRKKLEKIEQNTMNIRPITQMEFLSANHLFTSPSPK